MAESLLFSIATGIMESIGSQIATPGGAYASQMLQFCCCGEGELHSLRETVKYIQRVLPDAEKRQWQDKGVEHWVERLKDVLYDAQDLFDDISTEDLRRQAMPGNKMMKEVCLFFSESNQLAHGFNVANQIRQLRKKLDDIAYNNKFDFKPLPSEEKMATGRGKKPESLRPDNKIIGREEEKEKIKRDLFDSSSSNTVSVVSIVGKGGLGKTALARLVYNDGEVNGHFGLKMWVCVSDVFDVDLIFKEILKSAKGDCRGHDDDEMKKLLHDLENMPEDQLRSLLHETLGRKKYLLVLDDLWNEDRDKWLKLGDWLEGGLPGSKILVTTRSHKVAKVVDKKSVIHVLRGLSEDKSWNLFKKMAFGDGVGSVDPELEEMGLDIVKKCAGVPLAIRTIGGLLYGEKKDEWHRYKVRDFPEIPEIDEVDAGIMQVLNFSYDRLPSCLKHCFAYCSLFPKDYIYPKQTMIQLWEAQGFIESHSREDDLEEVANNYLEELLGRSFLDVEYANDTTDEVISFKMHDLMHDLAQKVGGGECKTVNFRGGDNDERIRHAFISEISSEEKIMSLLKTSKLRTFICDSSSLNSSKVLSECRHCRALVLDHIDIPLPPSSFKKSKHLRFLRIFENHSMQSLPDSIMDLVNLQVLELSFCANLKTFPRDLRKLINLRHLSIKNCVSLSHLPPLSELPSLKTLSLYYLLQLEFLQQTSDPEQSNTTRPFFPSLEELYLIGCGNLKGWLGRRQLIGADKKQRPDNSRSSFQKLRSVTIIGCPHLNDVAPFPHVQELYIDGTKMLANPNCPSEAAMGSTIIPFSALKHLCLVGSDLEPSKLDTLFQLASNLESLRLQNCKLRSLSGRQHLSSLQEVTIEQVEGFDLLCEEDEHGIQWRFLTKLRVLKINDSQALTALPEGIQHVKTLQSLEIFYCEDLESLPEWIKNFSSLEKLVLTYCPNLKRLPLEMRNLTRLTELRIRYCDALEEWCQTDGREEWPEIAHVLVIDREDR